MTSKRWKPISRRTARRNRPPSAHCSRHASALGLRKPRVARTGPCGRGARILNMAPLIEACRLRKAYPGVIALRDVDFSVEPGEVRALLGLNGAGKSTLVRVLSGATTPEGGTLTVDGTELRFAGPLDAQRAGLPLSSRSSAWCPDSRSSRTSPSGVGTTGLQAPFPLVDRRYVRETATRALELLGIGDSLEPGALVEDLSVSEQQLVECAKAVAMAAEAAHPRRTDEFPVQP